MSEEISLMDISQMSWSYNLIKTSWIWIQMLLKLQIVSYGLNYEFIYLPSKVYKLLISPPGCPVVDCSVFFMWNDKTKDSHFSVSCFQSAVLLKTPVTVFVFFPSLLSFKRAEAVWRILNSHFLFRSVRKIFPTVRIHLAYLATTNTLEKKTIKVLAKRKRRKKSVIKNNKC